MSQRWTLEAAIAFWRQHYRSDLEIVWDRFVAAEAFSLDHRPRNSREAEVLLEVLVEQGPDGRGDGRDQRALRRLQAFVRGLDPTEAVAA
jgi:hypothetical protein